MGNAGSAEGDDGAVGATLWQQACAVVPEPEQEEMSNIIGRPLIEENEALHGELQNLSDILTEYKAGTSDMFRRKQEARRALFGEQKLKLEDQLREMLERVKDARDLRALTPESGKVASDLLESGTTSPLRIGSPSVHARSESASTTPYSYSIPRALGGTLGGTASLNSTIGHATLCCSESADLRRYCQHLSLKGIDEFVRFQEIAEELRDLLREEHRRLLEDIDYIRSLFDSEITRRAKLSQASEAPVPALMSLKRELDDLDETNESSWASRLRRLPRVDDPFVAVDPMAGTSAGAPHLAGSSNAFPRASPTTSAPAPSPFSREAAMRFHRGGSGGFAGVFAAVAARTAQVPVPTPADVPVDPAVAQEDEEARARDWLALTAQIADLDEVSKAEAIMLLESEPRKRGVTPRDRFDILDGLDFPSDESD